MKKLSLLLVLLVSTLAFAQKEKLKGSRNVTLVPIETGSFTSIEIDDNLEVFLTQGDRTEVLTEADDNLHEAISVSVSGGALRLSVVKDVASYKKLAVQVTFNTALTMITIKDDARLTGLTDLRLDNFTIKTLGSAKAYATVRSTTFTLMGNDKSKAELNVTADNLMIEMSKNATVKALFSAKKMIADLYQKASANIEGDVADFKLRMDGGTDFTGKNLSVVNTEMICEGSANVGLAVSGTAVIEAQGKSEITLYGDQAKIEIRKFTDNAAIRKKPLK